MHAIKPDEVVGKKAEHIPDFVIEIFNLLIAKMWDGHKSVVPQKAALTVIAGRMVASGSADNYDDAKQKIFDERWLDVEDVYRAVGWKVEYDRPAYYETYEAIFIFTKA